MLKNIKRKKKTNPQTRETVFSNTVITLLTKYSHFETTKTALKAINQAIRNPGPSFSESFGLRIDKMMQKSPYGCPKYLEPELPNITVILPEHQTPSSQMVRQTSRLLSQHLSPPLPALCL